MNYEKVLHQVYQEIQPLIGTGRVADYIPELANISPGQFGMSLVALDGQIHNIASADIRFSIQSISKVFLLTLAFGLEGEKLWERVGVEPSGNPFNSLVQLEYDQGIPRNPLINAGALVVTDVLLKHFEDPASAVSEFVRANTGSADISINHKVAISEQEMGFRNAAMVNLLKSFGNIHFPVEQVLQTYFNICSIEMNCTELASAFLLYANHGTCPFSGQRYLTQSQTKRQNAIMQTCGFYDEAGEFTFKVGLPGKSGVGGGIAALYPQHFAIAVWSPGLNDHGNSIAGMKALELFTTETGMSIF